MVLDGLNTAFEIYRALSSSHWSLKKIQKRQLFQLSNLLSHAYNNVPIYRKLYNENRFHPTDFRSLNDLEKIPILKKEHLKAARPEEVISLGTHLEKCKFVNTSGSTGKPLRIYLGQAEDRWQRAVAWRILFEHGFRWNYKTLEIRMILGENYFIQRMGVASKHWVSILEPPESWLNLYLKTNHEVIVASASTLRTFAETIQKSGVKIFSPKIIISDSETLLPSTRRLIRTVFRTDPIDVYGLVELSNFAWQCEKRKNYHISADSHFVEIHAEPGHTGSIVATALGMRTMPIIRYDTGDLGEIETELCSCGRSLPGLKRIVGRAVDSVVLPNGRKILWPFFHEILGKYHELRQWRVIQKDLKTITLQLVFQKNDNNLLDKIRSDICDALPKKIRLIVEQVDRVAGKPGEKVRMVISNIESPCQQG